MKPITPQLAGGPQVRVAETQPQFRPVTVVRLNHPGYPATDDPRAHSPPRRQNSVVMAFEPTPEQRAKIAAGAAIYASLLTFGGPQQAILLAAGAEEMAAIYNVPVLEPDPEVPANA